MIKQIRPSEGIARIGHNGEAFASSSAFDYRVEPRRPEELRPNPNNPRTHTQKKIRGLAQAIRSIGFMTPIIIDDRDMIVAGNARLAAAIFLGLPRVPTIRASGLSPEKLAAFVLADNKFAERAGWDREKLAIQLKELRITLEPLDLDLSVTGFEPAEVDLVIEEIDADRPEPEDIPPPTAGLAVTRRGEVWLLGSHRLLCGDTRSSADLDQLMAGAAADAVVADAPYNVKVNGHVRGKGKTRHAEFAMASGEMSAPEFTKFLAAADKAGLTPLLSGARPLTLFVPTDAGVEGSPLASETATGQELQPLILYHVYGNKIAADQVTGKKGPVPTAAKPRP